MWPIHLAQAAEPVGFKVHVLDDREKFSNTERFPDAEEVIVDSIPSWPREHDLSCQLVCRHPDSWPSA